MSDKKQETRSQQPLTESQQPRTAIPGGKSIAINSQQPTKAQTPDSKPPKPAKNQG